MTDWSEMPITMLIFREQLGRERCKYYVHIIKLARQLGKPDHYLYYTVPLISASRLETRHKKDMV